MTETPLARARAGDEAAFTALTEPHRRELQVHCYRMLGSLHDAEDAVQETLVAAWRGLEGYAGRASVRTWLYRIATNRCLNVIRDGRRRPPAATLPFAPPEPTRMSEVSWLEPYPDILLDGLPDGSPGPEARYETREGVGLAFISGLARLPARQRAVLVLRDVLGYRAAEVADLLETSEATVNSALQRARAGLADREAPVRERAPAPGSPREREVAETFADAFERGETHRVVQLLTDDAWVKMPPEPHEYQGRAAIANFLRHASDASRVGRITRLVATRANGGPAFAHYIQEPGEALATLSGLLVLQLEGGRIAELTRFAASNLPAQFELEPALSVEGPAKRSSA
jgi:RNA polymerase sigma-70 factor (TIGR02960 family)